MPFESANPPAPPIRGVLRAELVNDLALGELSHEQLAEKYGRSPDAIHQFSSRNKDEIRRACQDLAGEYPGLWAAKKYDRLAIRQQLLQDIEERLQDPNLTDTQRNRYANTVDKLLRSIAEEKGELPSRIAIETDKPLLQHRISGVDMDRVFSNSGTQRRATGGEDQTFTPEPENTPEPVPVALDREPTRSEPQSRSTPEDRAYIRWLNT